MANIKITAPMSQEVARSLKAGDSCLISGVIYTARDAAHKRLSASPPLCAPPCRLLYVSNCSPANLWKPVCSTTRIFSTKNIHRFL